MDNNDIAVFDLLRNDGAYSVILSSLMNFVHVSFDKITKEMTNMSQIAGEVQEYVHEQCQLFIKIYSSSSSSSSVIIPFFQYEVVLESFESIITKALYSRLLSLLGTDTKFDRLVLKFYFLTENILGLPRKFNVFELQKQLKKFSEDFKEIMSPKGKLNALNNLSKYLKFYLNDNGLLYKGILFSIVKTHIPNIKSYLRYCSLFRNRILLTTGEEILLLNVTKAFDVIEQLSLNNINELIIPMDKFKELNDEFEKKNLIDNLTLSKGHFAYSPFIDDRLLALLNSGKDIQNNLYENNSEQNKQKDTKQIIELNKQSIKQLIQYYYHLEAKDTTMNELDYIRSLFNNLLQLVFKEKH